MPRVEVKVSRKLMEYTGGGICFELNAPTFHLLLEEMVNKYPELGSKVFSQKGLLSPFCRIFYNSFDLSLKEMEDFPIYERDQFYFVWALAGG